MCDKNSNLNKAILTQVQEFATNNVTFSVHDVTVELRKKANAGNLNLPEFEDNNGQYKYNIPHASVKTSFLDLLSDGIFTEIGLQLNRTYNQVYFEYNAVPVTPSSQPVVTAYTQTGPNPNYQATNPQPYKTTSCIPSSLYGNSTQKAPPTKLDRKSVEDKVSNYLDSHTGLQVSIEQIRAGIKCNGWTCAEILDIVKAQYPANKFTGNYPSKEMVNA